MSKLLKTLKKWRFYLSPLFKLSVSLTDDTESTKPENNIHTNSIKFNGVKAKIPNSIVKNNAVETTIIAVPIKNIAINNTNKNDLIEFKNFFICIFICY